MYVMLDISTALTAKLFFKKILKTNLETIKGKCYPVLDLYVL